MSALIVADVAQAHDGSLGLAHAFIDAVASTGAGAIKFQTHLAAAESTPNEPWRVRFSEQDATRYDYWKRMEFTEDQWRGLRKHADDRGLAFYSSPFSLEAVELLERVGVAGWKIASGEWSDPRLIERLASSDLPLIVSTGMSSLRDVDELMAKVRAHTNDVTLMQCTSMYPTPPDKLGLNMIGVFRERYGCKVGLSDHSGTPFAGIAAAALGIDMLEVHVTLGRQMFGPDVSSSLTPEELRLVVDGVRFVETARAHPVDKDAVAAELSSVREIFSKSVVAAADIAAGTVIGEIHLAAKKPGGGMPPSAMPALVGKRARRDIARDEQLRDDDVG